MGYRRIDAAAARDTVVAARRSGLTLARASAAAGLHVATTCRWQSRDPAFAAALKAVEAAAVADRFAARAAAEVKPARDPFAGVRRRPLVEVHPDCPACGCRTVVRKARHGLPFWGGEAWPKCGWASWRPRSPWSCEKCGGPTLWADSRASVTCVRCAARETGDANFGQL